MPQPMPVLSPEQLNQIIEQLGLRQTDGRTSQTKPITDLRLAPTATDPRPLFIPSAESPRNVDTTKVYDYPRLMFHGETGREITVYDAQHEAREAENGYQRIRPNIEAPDPIEAVRDELAELTPEERELVVTAQREARLKAVTARLAKLTDDELAAALDKTVVTMPKKRGRPRKNPE